MAAAGHVARLTMAIPRPLLDDALARIEALCDRRRPRGSDKARLTVTVDGNAVIIADEQTPWRDPADDWTTVPVARLRWTAAREEWSLQEPTLDGRWMRYRGARGPTRSVGPELDELDADPTGIFWG
jgi:hypothetical protein